MAGLALKLTVRALWKQKSRRGATEREADGQRDSKEPRQVDEGKRERKVER